MLVLSSPSGAGKTTLAKMLLATDDALVSSVSVTTRAARSGEVEGRDYFFITPEKYARLIEEDALLEYAAVHDNGYGTPRAFVRDALTEGRDILFDIDWQGAQQLRHNVPQDLVTVFILPPSADELHRRLNNRGSDTPEVIAARLAKAGHEISHWAEYDYVLVNENPEESANALRGILTAERLKRRRQTGLTDFIRNLNL